MQIDFSFVGENRARIYGDAECFVNVEHDRRYTFREYHRLTNRIVNIMPAPRPAARLLLAVRTEQRRHAAVADTVAWSSRTRRLRQAAFAIARAARPQGRRYIVKCTKDDQRIHIARRGEGRSYRNQA